MRPFLIKTLLFIFIPALVIFAFLIGLNFINYKIANAEHYTKSITTVYLGDSHIAKAINDTLMNNTINLAKSAESYYFSYYKLKVLLKNNSSIKYVYLGYSYHNVSSFYDKYIDGELSNAISNNYFYLLPMNEKISLIVANRNNLLSYIKVLFSNGIHDIKSKEKTYKGGYENAFSDSKSNEKSMQKRIVFQYYKGEALNDFSSKNIEYLEKIRDLCKESNVNLTLINTPLHKFYKSKVPKKFLTKFEQLPKDLGIEILDLSSFLSEESSFMPDGDHVSQKGATQTTEYLNSQANIRMNEHKTGIF